MATRKVCEKNKHYRLHTVVWSLDLYNPRIFFILQHSKKCQAFYKIALPVYFRDYLSNLELKVSLDKHFFSIVCV